MTTPTLATLRAQLAAAEAEARRLERLARKHGGIEALLYLAANERAARLRRQIEQAERGQP
jgi:hypothetical protein